MTNSMTSLHPIDLPERFRSEGPALHEMLEQLPCRGAPSDRSLQHIKTNATRRRAIFERRAAEGHGEATEDGARYVVLTRGLRAIVDDIDFARVSEFVWGAFVSARTSYGRTRVCFSPTEQATVRLHRFVCDYAGQLSVDHIDGNGLNCRRANLRLCTHRQNMQNRRPLVTRRYQGINFNGKKWIAHIKSVYLGSFNTEEEAAIAFDVAAKLFKGEFAYLNIPNADHSSIAPRVMRTLARSKRACLTSLLTETNTVEIVKNMVRVP